MRFLAILVFTVAVALPSFAAAADWGDLKMRFVYDGEPPQPKLINQRAAGAIPDESLLVNERDRGLKNVCVWLLYGGDDPLPVHPDYAKSSTGKVTMKIAAGQFVPRIVHLQPTQTLVVSNADSVGYDVLSHSLHNDAFNVLAPPGASFERQLKSLESSPFWLGCSIHGGLIGYVLVSDNPYGAVSDEHGNLSLANVPAGRWIFVFWHERSGYLKKVIYSGHTYDLTRGQSSLTIKPGDNDLGEIKLRPEQFRK